MSGRTKPLCVDLFCGLGGWAEGFLAEGFDVVGFDIERHEYGEEKYPAQLVLQDVLTLSGSQFKGKARVIVASPPCQEPSYRAMPWSRAKALNAIGPPHKFIELFNACFRIAKEADLPLIVENVRGAQVWVGRAGWHFGAFYLWGDLPALMPITRSRKVKGQNWSRYTETGEVSADWTMEGLKANTHGESIKNNGGSWFNVANNTTSGKGQNPDGRKVQTSCAPRRWEDRDVKRLRDVPVFGWKGTVMQQGTSHGSKRKRASAMIAKIPFPLASHIARCFKARP